MAEPLAESSDYSMSRSSSYTSRSSSYTSRSSSYTSRSSTAPSSVSSVNNENVSSGGVAIIGMSCRTAGGNNTPEKLWQFILDKKDASGDNPSWRWEPWMQRDPRNAKIIEEAISKGYFIEDLENFDASFFGISPKEAELMDPHQRIGLEVAWEALENAGIDPKSLAGSDTAVYMGVTHDDYARLMLEDLPNIEAWMGTGTAPHGIPNRISYHLDLMGPSAAVDAACASSLVAVHAGRQAITSGESRVAIVGGVNICTSPALFHMLGKAGALSPDGVCRSFDDEANGYARGEGAAVLILKRLSHAILDGDHILATLRGTAVGQDGKTNGIMAPNAKAQELVARKALKVADVDPLSVGYVEAHATSTKLGDPTEISSITAVYGSGRPSDAPVAVGSIKPNVGHLEAAAGAISLIKSVLAVNKGLLPPQTRLNKLNSKVDWDKSGLYVVRECNEWCETDGPRRAAVCSYGYGGTVSHAIVEQSPVPFLPLEEIQSEPTLLVLSAPQEKRLGIQSATQAEWMSSTGKNVNLKTIAATLAQRRTHHDFRAAFVVSSQAEASASLNSFATGDASEWCTQGRVLGNGANKEAIWVFSGQGAQWADMGKELLQNPFFYNSIAPLDEIVLQEVGYSAIERLESGNFQSSGEIQVLTYLTQIGLSQVLRSKGIRPHAVVGHSFGEMAAAVTAGCLTPEEGTLIVTRRSCLFDKVSGLGGMFLVSRPFAEISAELGDRKDVVAAIDSSPSSCVISGAMTPLAKFIESLKERGVRALQVKTDVAFHSPMLDGLRDPLENALANVLNPQPPVIKLYSTSQVDSRSQILRGANYWVNNMINPVRLASAVNAAIEDGYRTFLEVSTHPIVLQSVEETLAEKDLKEFCTISTMKKNKPAEKSILNAIGQLYVAGSSVDFASFTGQQWSSEVPGFSWSHRQFWKDVSCGSGSSENVHDVNMHTMLGQRTVIAGTNTTFFTTKIEESNKPFPLPHLVQGTNIIPAAVYVNTFHHATGARVLSQMMLNAPLAITDDTRNVQTIVEGDCVKVASRLSSSDHEAWVTHTTAHWSTEPLTQSLETHDLEATKKRIDSVWPKNFSIDYLAKVGVSGIAFPWVVLEHHGNSKEMLVKVDNDPDNETMKWNPQSWAPILDSATSIGSTMFFDDPKLRIVSQIDKLTIHSNEPSPKVYYLYVTESEPLLDEPRSRCADVSVLNTQGEILAQFESLRLTELEHSSTPHSGSVDSLVHQMAWIPALLSERPLPLKQAVLISKDCRMLDQYGSELQRHVSKVTKISTTEDLKRADVSALLEERDSVVVYCPGLVDSFEDIANSSHGFVWDAINAVKFIVEHSLPSKFFVITDRVFASESATALAQAPLHGLARVVASEHSDVWGGLIDNEGPSFPSMPLKYVRDQEVIRYVDGVPRIARLRPLSADQRLSSSNMTLLPKPEGTYVVTGGLGALGLETCDFLIEKGARRLVIVSRRELPPRRQWSNASAKLAPILDRVRKMEKLGASIHVVSQDIGAEDAHEQLLAALDRLSLPPVLGIVHASGVLEDGFLVETSADSLARVLSPKISGAIALHKAFPPGTLDFFVLYSSIGQLIGVPGQSSYASGNGFLDALAAHRRNQGDNAVAFQWNCWQNLGMGSRTDFLTVELQSKGITYIKRDEAFRAWTHLSDYNMDHAVVTRTLSYEEGEVVPCALVEEVVGRHPRASNASAATEDSKGGDSARPTNAQELKTWLDMKIRECVGRVMKLEDIEEIDSRATLLDAGFDSVMTMLFRQELQRRMKVKVPQTLIWTHPTIVDIVEWFVKHFEEEARKN